MLAIANPGYPGTTRLFAGLMLEALLESGLPSGLVQLIYQVPPELGLKLVAHPLVGATGFTGANANCWSCWMYARKSATPPT